MWLCWFQHDMNLSAEWKQRCSIFIVSLSFQQQFVCAVLCDKNPCTRIFFQYGKCRWNVGAKKLKMLNAWLWKKTELIWAAKKRPSKPFKTFVFFRKPRKNLHVTKIILNLGEENEFQPHREVKPFMQLKCLILFWRKVFIQAKVSTDLIEDVNLFSSKAFSAIFILRNFLMFHRIVNCGNDFFFVNMAEILFT